MKVQIYGDSIMKAIVVDENFKYHPLSRKLLSRFEAQTGVDVESRAHFGYTTTRGQELLDRDLEKGLDCQYALLEFGGNDCDFDWPKVAAAPQGEHQPHTSLQQFVANLRSMATRLLERGIKPVFMTLPPLDAEKYLSFIGRLGSDTKAILQWLGDVQTIYRWQEMYSSAVAQLAAAMNCPLIDIRSHFLSRRDCKNLIARDGIHLTEDGYQVIYDQCTQALAAI